MMELMAGGGWGQSLRGLAHAFRVTTLIEYSRHIGASKGFNEEIAPPGGAEVAWF